MKKITLIKGRSYARSERLFKKDVPVEVSDGAAEILMKTGRFAVEDLPEDFDDDDDFEDDLEDVAEGEAEPFIHGDSGPELFNPPVVEAGVEPVVDELPAKQLIDLSKMSAADLRVYAEGLGLDVSECKNRQQVEEMILSRENKQEEVSEPSYD